MPEEAPAADTVAPAETSQQQTPTPPPKPQTLEEMLADLDEDRRKVILDQVAKPRNEAKSLRDRLKAVEPKAAEYDRLEQASKSDQERLQEQLHAAQQRVAATTAKATSYAVKAALAGVVDDPDGIVDDLNLAKFVNEDGDIDTDAIDGLRKKYAAFSRARAPRPDTSQGSSGNGNSKPSSPAEEFAAILKNRSRP